MNNSDIVKRFGKSNLINVAEELGIEVGSSVRAVKLVEIIEDDLYTNGVPEDMSEVLEDLAFVLGFIDEDGNLIDDEDDEEEEEVIEEGDLPGCWGYADDRDPACNKCKIYDMCMKERIALRPPCFGKMYDSHSPECECCIEALDCKQMNGGK